MAIIHGLLSITKNIMDATIVDSYSKQSAMTRNWFGRPLTHALIYSMMLDGRAIA